MEWTINGRPYHPDYVDVMHFLDWLSVFASPQIYRAMRRKPTREHIISLLDIYASYARSDRHYVFSPIGIDVDFARRAELATRLRQLFDTWSPSDVPSEITEVARGLLLSEGALEPKEGWDILEADPAYPPEQCLRWPEGIPALLSK